jgi:hypothetical protein
MNNIKSARSTPPHGSFKKHYLKDSGSFGIFHLMDWYIWYIVSGLTTFVGMPNSEVGGSMLLQNVGNCLKSA